MKAGICSRMWRPAAGAMLVGAMAFAVTAQGGPRATDGSARTRTKSESARQVTGPVDNLQSVVAGGGGQMDIRLTPKASYGPIANPNASPYVIVGGAYTNANITGQTLTVNSGGFMSVWNLEMLNWDPENDGPYLRSWQARVDAMTYINGVGGPLNPGNTIACANGAACTAAIGEAGSLCIGGFCEYGFINKSASRDDQFNEQDPDPCDPFTYDKSLVNPAGPLYFASTAPDDEPNAILCAMRDPHRVVYAGTLMVGVPANAKGTYNIGFVDNETFPTDPGLNQFPLRAEVPGTLVIPTGKCCFGVGGPGPGCTDDLTATECAALAPVSIFGAGDTCDNPPSDEGCCACLTAGDCNDNDACTTDTCSNCTCSNAPVPSWDQGTECCNAATGAQCTPGTEHSCETSACSIAPNRGDCVDTPIAAGQPCAAPGDDNPCTYNDVCDGTDSDNCAGTDVNGEAIACTTDADCLTATGLSAATCVSGLCNCTLVPDLTVDIDESGKADPNCFDSGDDGAKVTATVHVAAATAPINGGQFLITYDPTCLDYNSAVGVAPYTDMVYGPVVDEAAGTIFAVVGVGFGVGDGPAGNADMLSLSFTKIGDCNSCQICFASNNPQNTYLVDSTGQRVGVNPVCSKAVVANNEIAIDVPDNIKANVDCDEPTSTQTWSAPSVSDSCGTSTLTCSGQHQSGASMDHLANGGGEFPVGVTNFCCEAVSDWCDKTAEECWTVEINDQVGLDIDIALSPTQQSKPADDLTRCIKFTLYPNTIQAPFHFSQDITFGGLFDFVGKSDDSLKIPSIGQWDCISAWDQLHTLRACYLFDGGDCVNGRLHAEFKGDPAFGGNWLIGGNLDGWKKNVEGSEPSLFVIDILDYGTFVSQWGADYGSGDTPCGTPGPNADINGDGLVTLEDYAFISMNFLASAKLCCGVEGLPADIRGTTEITVRELRERGLAELAAGDVNGDGLLNVEDMNAFTQGARPETKGVRGVRKGSGTR